jgi:hypothetical protein
MGDIEDAKKWRAQQIMKRSNHEMCPKCGRPKKCRDPDCTLMHCNCNTL